MEKLKNKTDWKTVTFMEIAFICICCTHPHTCIKGPLSVFPNTASWPAYILSAPNSPA